MACYAREQERRGAARPGRSNLLIVAMPWVCGGHGCCCWRCGCCRYGSYQELLDSDVDAIYITIPCALRKEWIVKGALTHVRADAHAQAPSRACQWRVSRDSRTHGRCNPPQAHLSTCSRMCVRACVRALAAAKAKKHILAEKPLGPNLEECLEMVAACKARGTTPGPASAQHRHASQHWWARLVLLVGAFGLFFARFHSLQLTNPAPIFCCDTRKTTCF